MQDHNILLAGFGGQGVLFAGKVIAYAGLIEERHLSWLPSYGPEMRGGTANCSVSLSDEPIGSPLVLSPSLLVAMNRPSFDKFANTVAPGGVLVADSSLVEARAVRADIKGFFIPATELSETRGLKGLSNMILLGKALQESAFASTEAVKAAVLKCVPAKKQHLAEPNIKAIELGMSL